MTIVAALCINDLFLGGICTFSSASGKFGILSLHSPRA